MATAALMPARDAGRAPVALQGGNVVELIGDAIKALIALLDALDGDVDLEEDDPHPASVEDEGEADQTRGLPLPVYGEDQSRGPLNVDVLHEWYFDHALSRCVSRHG